MTHVNHADVYRYLAQHSEHALLATVVAAAGRKDHPALIDFLSTMEEMGYRLSNFSSSAEAPCRYRLPEALGGNDVDVPRASFPRALMAAIAPSPYREDGFFKDRIELLWEPLSTASLDFLARCAEFGKPQCSQAFTSKNQRTHFHSAMLFHAASMTADERVFHALIDAGASTKKKLISNHGSSSDKTVSVFKEALLFGNLPGAQAVLSRMTPQDAVDAIVDMTEGPQSAGKSYAQNFHDRKDVVFLTHALHSGQSEQVGRLLDIMCQQAQTLGTGGSRGQRCGGVFRTMLAASYLRDTHTKKPWTEDAVLALRGTNDRFSIDSTIHGQATAWRDYKADSPGEMWMLQDPTRKIGFTDYHYLMADLAHQAVRTHCTPIVEDVRSYLAPTGRQGPDIGTALSFDEKGGAPSASRLKATIDILTAEGHSVNEAKANYADGGTPMHAASALSAPSLAVALPILLALSPDRSALDKDGQTPRQKVKDDEAQKTWDSITRSFDARNAAHGILSAIEDLEDESPTPSKIPKP